MRQWARKGRRSEPVSTTSQRPLRVVSARDLGHMNDLYPGRHVMITFIEDLYWHVQSVKACEICDEIKKKLCGSLTSLEAKPEIGQLVIAPFVDGYYRAEVLKTKRQDDRAQVRFVDYGNVEVVNILSLRAVPEACLETPMLARKCQLKGVTLVEGQTCDGNKTGIQGSIELTCFDDGEVPLVGFKYHGDDVAELLVKKGICTPIERALKPDEVKVRSVIYYVIMDMVLCYESFLRVLHRILLLK